MKKLITMAIAVMLGVIAAQAASVKWNTGAIIDPDTGLNAGNNNTLFLATVYFYEDAAGVNVFQTDSKGVTQLGGAIAKETGNWFTAGATYYAQIIIEKLGDGPANPATWTITSDIGQLNPMPGTGALSMNFASGSNVVGGASLYVGDWVPIPEPTSFALLGLGVMAFALRRRVK